MAVEHQTEVAEQGIPEMIPMPKGAGETVSTPPCKPGDPPELVPMAEAEQPAAAAPAAAQGLADVTPTKPLAADWKYMHNKASTPNPARFCAADQVYLGAHTPPAVSKYGANPSQLLGSERRSSDAEQQGAPETADELRTMMSHLTASDEAAATVNNTQTTNTASDLMHQQQQQQQQHQQQQQQQHQQQQQQQQPTGPGTLYPVWDEGKLVGYMAVPSTDVQPEQQQLPMQQRVPQYGMGDVGNGMALSEININQQRPRLAAKDVTAMHGGNPQMQMQQLPTQDWSNEMGIDIFTIKGRIIEVARDHAGSRALQRRLDMGCSDKEKQALFEEVEPKCSELMVHMFGNYVVQKLFEHGLPSHVSILSEKLKGNVLSLTLSPYGCRVIQKALEVFDPRYRNMVVEELTGQVPRCVQDQNGNHVIQKCIETMPGRVDFIVCAFKNNVQALAMHAYGCRVIQRLLEYCKRSAEVEPIIQEVLSSVNQLVGDRYGNYVVQHVIINGEPQHRAFIFNHLKGSTLALARGKFSSNVVEKMFEFGNHQERDDLLAELLQHSTPDGMSGLLAMVQDPFANYVVQKMLDCCDDSHQRAITEHIRPHVAALRRFNYGKHIISRLEKAGMSLGASQSQSALGGMQQLQQLQQQQQQLLLQSQQANRMSRQLPMHDFSSLQQQHMNLNMLNQHHHGAFDASLLSQQMRFPQVNVQHM